MEAINDNHSDIRKYGGTNQAEFFCSSFRIFLRASRLTQKETSRIIQDVG